MANTFKECSFRPMHRLYIYNTFIVLVLLTFLAGRATAQDALIDSLKRSVANERNDTLRVRLHVRIGFLTRFRDTTESWNNQREIVRIAKAMQNDFFHGQAYFLAATIQMHQQPLESIGNFEKAIRIFSVYPNNRLAQLSMGMVYVNMGLLHNGNNDYEAAIGYYLKAEDIYLKHDPRSSDLTTLCTNLSITYGTINKYDEGLTFSRKALDQARKGSDKGNLMRALYAYGGNLVNAKKGDGGLALLDSAKLLATELNDIYYIYSSDFMKAMYYYNTRQYAEAIRYYTICQDLARKLNSPPDIGNNFLNIAACEAEMKQPLLAAAHLDSSARYLDYSVISVSKQMYFENYAEVYKQLGLYTKAFAFKDSVGAIKDSLYQADNIRQIEFRQARFNYERRQHEIAELETHHKLQQAVIARNNTITAILIAGALTLLVILVLSYRSYRQSRKLQQQRIKELETEKQLTATEAVLKGEEQERTRLAKDLHDGLGGMLSGMKYSFNMMKGNLVMTPENLQAFERSMDMLDSSIMEMRRVAHNMMPETLVRFGLDTALNDFCNDINQSGALQVTYQSIGLANTTVDQTIAITIYRVVQELISNTIRHSSSKTALVQVTKTGDQLAVTVEDEGKGFDPSILRQSKGIGWTNIQHRVDFLKGKMDVNTAPGKGTSVHIEFRI
ncbi:MAG TPA: sensor histidine kinase [Ohtaekwangia sp.]|nr:sensor histidine kinase [Ohtaekwangia sp.]